MLSPVFLNLLNWARVSILDYTGTAAPGALYGLNLSNDGGSPATVLDIAAGSATDSTNATLMVQSTAFTKSTAAFAVGTGNGGLDTGAVANSTWYHVFLIGSQTTGATDVLFSTSLGSPTMPSGFTLFRRIGSFLTDGAAHIISFIQQADVFLWKTPIQNENAFNISNAQHLTTMTVPPGVKVWAKFTATINNTVSAGMVVLFYDPDMGAQAVNSPTGFQSIQAAVANVGASSDFSIVTNTSRQIATIALAASANNQLWIVTYGWVDFRGKL